MAQQAQNDIFVREWTLRYKTSESSMGLSRLVLCREDKKTQIKKNKAPQSNPRRWCSYIDSNLSKYKMFFLFLFPIASLVFMKSLPLYSLVLFNPSLPLVDHIGDPLGACPIRNLLEAFVSCYDWDNIV